MSEFTPGPGDTGQPTLAPATPGPSAAPPAATPSGGTPPPATPGGPPAGYIPVDQLRYRFQEIRESATQAAQQEFAKREAALNAQIEEHQRKLQALAGFAPPTDQKADSIRSEFAKLYPGLAKLESMADKFENMAGQFGDLNQQVEHYWEVHARNTLDKLSSLYQEATGNPVNDVGREILRTSLTGFLQAYPDAYRRYQTDPNFVQDYWRAVSATFIDPARRANAAATASRVPQGLPQDSPSGSPQTTPPPTYASLDERAAASWQAFQHKVRGG